MHGSITRHILAGNHLFTTRKYLYVILYNQTNLSSVTVIHFNYYIFILHVSTLHYYTYTLYQYNTIIHREEEGVSFEGRQSSGMKTLGATVCSIL
jgi:hypothetical protein